MGLSEIDPDSSFRESKSLHPTDLDENEKFISELWYFLRSGQQEKAIDHCRKTGEFWRGATLDSITIFNEKETEKQKNNGNVNRKETIKVLNDLAEDTSLSDNERSLYGSLCGNLNAMNLSSKNWNDRFWAELKASIESTLSFAIETYPNEEFKVAKKVMDIVESLGNKEMQNTIQSLLALDDYTKILKLLEDQITEKNQIFQEHFHHTLRFATHLLLFLKQNKLIQETDKVIEHYLYYLANKKEWDLVIFFTKKLSENQKIEVFSKILNETNEEEKIILIKKAKKEYLPIEDITKAFFEEIKKQQAPHLKLLGKINPVDKKKIESLSILTYLPQNQESYIQGNYLLRSFIPNEKYEEAKLVIEKLEKKEKYEEGKLEKKGKYEEPKLEKKVFGEYMIWKNIIQSFQIDKKIIDFYKDKPDNSQPNHLKSWDEQFKNLKDEYSKTIVKVISNPDWKCIEDEKVIKDCLPKIIFLFLNTLISIRDFDKCFDLCILIVSESITSKDSSHFGGNQEFKIYSYFSKTELKKLMKLFKDIQVEIDNSQVQKVPLREIFPKMHPIENEKESLWPFK